jgi:predicted nucleic acid-binding protein
MPSRDALLEVERLARVCRVLDLTPAAVLDGCRACNDYQISFWDAMIWAVARANGVDVVLSEDFDHDRVLEGVRFLNPFVEAFDMALLET